MVSGCGINASIPLPEFRPPYGCDIAQSVRFRRFAVIEDDLSIDFSTRNRAALATRLLELCAVDPRGVLPPNFFTELTVGKRIECLLSLAMGESSGPLSLQFKCRSCGEELEIELTRDEVATLQREADLSDTVEVVLDEMRLRLRKCSGRDQDAWFDLVCENEHRATLAMIVALAIEAPAELAVSAHDIEIIEGAMDAADPLVNLRFDVDCTACGEANECSVDLLETAFAMLDNAQRRLIHDVHRLAATYHWSESEIFDVPVWRREKYINLITGMR